MFSSYIQVHAWSLDSFSLAHVKNSETKKEYQNIVDRLSESLDFMKTIGLDNDEQANNSLSNVEMFMSHEGFLISDLICRLDTRLRDAADEEC